MVVMDPHEQAQSVDLWDIRLRATTVRFAVWITIAVCSISVVYVAATWSQPNRPIILGLLSAAMVTAIVAGCLDAERIVRSHWREAFFVTWSVLDIAFVGAIEGLDGGTKSPVSLIYFLPLVFAALSYPLPAVVAIALLDMAACTGVGVFVADTDWIYLSFFAATLGCTALLCVWQARNHDRQRIGLAEISRTDPLTECLNRRGFEERLDSDLQQTSRQGRPLSLLLLDLDDFKGVNDTMGHEAGDELLRWVVQTVRTTLRPFDDIGRLGGDEFAVLLPAAARPDAAEVGQRIGEVLAERISVTIGIATFPVDGSDREELHRSADAELYAAKHGSKLQPGFARRDLGWVASLAHTVDKRMTPPEDHSSQVARYAGIIARQLGWSGEDLGLIRLAGMLHDIGKIAIPDRILLKPGQLTDEEQEAHIRRHPILGAELVSRVEGLGPAVMWIRHSHENWDGSGYPDGLSGEAIPLGSRMLHVAEAFAAMTGRRTYRDTVSREEALEELERCAGRQFDPVCVQALAVHLSGSAEAA
jgi:diguanylate cyclase (GGDEF)-like protein/putative nucleotidyltransferase with HDIG domain